MHRNCFSLLLFVAIALVAPLGACAEPDKNENGDLQLEDSIQELRPIQPRSELESDRVQASTLFTHGRLLFRRQDYEGALKNYQRAWRLDPESVTILREIVPLASAVKRNPVAFRYAVIAAEKDPRDAALMRRLAALLTRDDQFGRAARMYEAALQVEGNPTTGREAVLVRVEMGRLFFLDNQFEKSADAFSVVRDALKDPKKFKIEASFKKTLLGEAHRTYGLMGEAFLQAKRFDDATEMFREADKAKSDKASLSLNLARVASDRGNTGAALKQLDEYFNTKSADGGDEPYALLAELLKKTTGDQEEAKRKLTKRMESLHAKDAQNASLTYYLAGLKKEAGKLDKSAKLYESVIGDSPRSMAYLSLIEIYREKGEIEKLVDVLAQAAIQAGSLERLGDEIKSLNEDTKTVEKVIAAARKRMSGDDGKLGDGVAYAVGLLALAAKKFDVADEFLELAAAGDKPPKRQVIVTWGLQLLMSEQYEQAATVFQRAIEEKVVPDDNPELHFYMAGAREMAGQTEKALEAAKKAVEIDPKAVRLQSRIPWVLYHAKRYDDAAKAYSDLLEKHDSNYDSDADRDTMRDVRFAMSNICIQQDRIPESEEWLEQVLDEFPEDIGAMNDLGYLWADQGKNLRRSLAMVRKAVESEPDNIAYRDSMGWAFYRLGRFSDAVKELEKAVALDDEPDGVILDHLGDAYLGAGQKEQAIKTWKRAAGVLKKQEDDKQLKKTEAKIKKHAAE